MVHIGRGIKRSAPAITFTLVGRESETAIKMYTCAFIHFPISHQTRIHRLPFGVTLISGRRILVTSLQILFLIHGSDISVPVEIIIHVSVQSKLLPEFVRHIHSDGIIDIVLVCTVLITVGRPCDKRKVLSVLAEIVHLSFQILLLMISISYRRICQPSLV